MTKHKVEVCQDDNVFLVKCSEFQGCHSYGPSLDEALKNLKEAIACCDNTPEHKMYEKELEVIHISKEEWEKP